MLLVDVGVILSVYVGSRLFEYYNNKEAVQTESQPPDKQTALVKTKNSKEKMQDHDDTEKKHNHHLKVSTAALGLTALSYIYPQLKLLSFGVITYSTLPLLKQTENSLLEERRFKSDLMNSIVTVTCLATGQYFAAVLQVWSYHLGNKMVFKTQDLSSQMITHVFEQQPNNVWILKDQSEIEISLDALQINDTVVIRTGEVIPIDGTIIAGIATIDQHALTGEAVPAEKGLGDKVFAATLVVSGWLHVKVEKRGTETTVAKLGEILTHTAEFKTHLQLNGEKWSDRLTLPLISLSLFSLPVLGTSSAMAILYSAPVNATRILPSLHTFNHLILTSKKGILVKDGRALEELVKIDTILFDKTGTLTKGQPKVGQIIVCDDLRPNELLSYAAIAECRLTHPIARAIVNAAEKRRLNASDHTEQAHYKMGYGIQVHFKNQIVKVGSARFMTLEGIAIPPQIAEALVHAQNQGYSFVMVAIDDQLKGAIEIQPQVRPEVKRVLKRLRQQQGIQKIFIVSGDHQQPTQKLAEELGMDDCFYEVLPEDKAHLVEQLQKQGRRVCFVGDGINDAIAMKKANVSVSLRGAASIATDMAQVVLMDDHLSHLCDLLEISKDLNTNLQHSLLLAATYGVTNTAAATLFNMGIVNSTILFSVVLGTGMGHAMWPLRGLKQKDSKKFQGAFATSF